MTHGGGVINSSNLARWLAKQTRRYLLRSTSVAGNVLARKIAPSEATLMGGLLTWARCRGNSGRRNTPLLMLAVAANMLSGCGARAKSG